MTNSKLEIKINITDTGLFKNLVELLEEHFDDLPIELQDSLKELSNPLNKNLTADDFIEASKDIDGEFSHSVDEIDNILYVNIGLKKIYYLAKNNDGIYDKKSNPTELELNHFWCKKGNTIIWEW